MPLVTVVTAARNAERFVAATIASIRAQTLTDWEYVIVDDASTDRTAVVADDFAKGDRRIRVVRLEESLGSYGAANTAMLRADCRFLARIDADDLAVPDRLAKQVSILQATPALASTGAAELFDAVGARGLRAVPSKSNGVVKWMLWLRNCLVHSTLLIRRDVFEEIGGYGPEPVSEDHRLWATLVRKGSLSIVDDVLVRYRLHEGQITSSADSRDLPARVRVTFDHMRRCTDDPWTIDDAKNLGRIGERTVRFPTRTALDTLARFEASWRKDFSLSAADRRQLGAFTSRRVLRHLRHNLASDIPEVVSAAMGHPIQVLGGAVRTIGDRSGARWP